MPAADPRRSAGSYVVGAVATLLVFQLGVAAGAVATRARGGGAAAAVTAPAASRPAAPARSRTRATRPPVPVTPAPVPPVPAPVPVPDAPVRVSADGLWPGTVTAEPLAVAPDGTLGVPRTAQSIGWWAAGTRPGDVGAAVLVGHVDLDGRPGIFGRLARAAPGTIVTVDAGQGPVRFRVSDVRQYPKDAFPADAVYEPTADRELRLITCGGRFDRRTGHYADNVVVTAVLA